jgi:hypothetical protein
MFYREMSQNQNMDLGNPGIPNIQQRDGDICPHIGTDCPFIQNQEQEFDPTMIRQRRRRRPYYHYRPYYYPYYQPYYQPYYPPYYSPYYPSYYPPYYPWRSDED